MTRTCATYDEALLSDIESTIHHHFGSGWDDDAHNDWVHDLATELLALITHRYPDVEGAA